MGAIGTIWAYARTKPQVDGKSWIPCKSAFYLRVDDFAPFVHVVAAFRAFHASCAPRPAPFGTRQGRKKAAPTHGDGSPLDRSIRGPDFLAQF